MPRKTFSPGLASIAILAACAVACGRSASDAPEPAAAESVAAETPATEPAPASDATSDSVVGQWTLQIPVDLRTPALPEDFLITIEFGTDGAVNGSSGCNRYSGRVELTEDGGISVGPLAATKMACPSAQMQLEESYLSILGGVTAYRFRKGNLELLKNDQPLLVFLPVA